MLPHKIKALWEQCKSKSNILFKSIKEQTDNYSDVSFYIAIICICSFIILYYPVGAILTNNINRNLDIKIDKISPNQSMAIDMVSHLINEEVNEKIWTPNLPFFFPAAILDNMPNYQLGILNSLSKFTSALEKSNHKKTKDEEKTNRLYRATVLLRYPGTIWMFDSHNKIKPVPSASSQYRKARRLLKKYNHSLITGDETFTKSPQNLAFILQKSNLNLKQSEMQITSSIRENSKDWFDFKADDIFYYNQGKLYAYYLLFRALGDDYKKIIVDNNQYQNWITLIKALEDAVLVQPSIVSNGNLSGSVTPNHLAYLNAYILKAQNILAQMIIQFNKTSSSIKDSK